MSKLTLSVPPEVVARAKRYAKERGVSISELVAAYLSAVANPPESTDEPPVLRALRGTLKKAKIEDYHRHLAEKYR
ncbi:MAG TPA: DUF6364 family protein [Bryobacteraceae bacterium]|nr:DUF6364 family protein [Bryobacteraceae bacterium]